MTSLYNIFIYDNFGPVLARIRDAPMLSSGWLPNCEIIFTASSKSITKKLNSSKAIADSSVIWKQEGSLVERTCNPPNPWGIREISEDVRPWWRGRGWWIIFMDCLTASCFTSSLYFDKTQGCRVLLAAQYATWGYISCCLFWDGLIHDIYISSISWMSEMSTRVISDWVTTKKLPFEGCGLYKLY